ncbi:hypothetical protein Leryth_004049, partial [Lithospermum erythrorhizon]
VFYISTLLSVNVHSLKPEVFYIFVVVLRHPFYIIPVFLRLISIDLFARLFVSPFFGVYYNVIYIYFRMHSGDACTKAIRMQHWRLHSNVEDEVQGYGFIDYC